MAEATVPTAPQPDPFDRIEAGVAAYQEAAAGDAAGGEPHEGQAEGSSVAGAAGAPTITAPRTIDKLERGPSLKQRIADEVTSLDGPGNGISASATPDHL